MEIRMNDQRTVDAKILRVVAETMDRFSAELHDENGEPLAEDYMGDVPNFLVGEYGNHYLVLDIDIETGQVANWRKPSRDELEEMFGE